MTDLGPTERELKPGKVMVVAAHIGAAGVDRTDVGWRFKCPECGAWDFWTANSTLVQAVTLWLDGGRLPGGVLLGGVCMSCEYIVDPQPRNVEVEDEGYDLDGRATLVRNKRGETREEAWARWFEENPKVLACWSHQNGYWPYEPSEQAAGTAL